MHARDHKLVYVFQERKLKTLDSKFGGNQSEAVTLWTDICGYHTEFGRAPQCDKGENGTKRGKMQRVKARRQDTDHLTDLCRSFTTITTVTVSLLVQQIVLFLYLFLQSIINHQ